MAIFDLANATVSNTFIDNLATDEGIVPFVYSDLKNAGDTRLVAGASADPVSSSWSGTTAGYYSQSGTGATGSGYYSKIPLDPARHKNDITINGTPTFGIGQTAVSFVKPGTTRMWNTSDNVPYKTSEHFNLNLYDLLHNSEYGVRVKVSGTWYNIYFPIEHDLDYAKNSNGGFWIDTDASGSESDGVGGTGALKNTEPIPIKYTGDGSTITNSSGVTLIKARPSIALMKALSKTAVDITYGAGVIDAFYRYTQTSTAWVKQTDGSGNPILEAGCFPYTTSLAQAHFDAMVNIAWHKGTGGFKYSWFVQTYKYKNSTDQTLRDGSAITTTSHLSEYKEAAFALMFMAVVYDRTTGKYAFKEWAVKRYRKHVQTFLTGSVYTGSIPPSSPAFSVDPDPLLSGYDWYEGYPISDNWFYAPKDWYGGYFTGKGGTTGWNVRKGQSATGGQINPSIISGSTIDPTLVNESSSHSPLTVDEMIDQIGSIPLPPVDFWQGKSSTGVNVDYEDYYSGNRSIYDSDAGSADYWKTDPNYQAYYSKYWQDANSWFHGATAASSPRPATKHGPVLASTHHNSLPSFIIGLNESGAGTSKVYMRSVTSQSTVESGTATDDCFDIAKGESLGTIDYNQWNHFAITREGNNFYTFKNGTMVSTWRSDKAIKIPQPDTKLWASEGLNLSIGKSQGADYFYGYLDGLRITKGTAKHSINTSSGVVSYTVPTSAPTVETASTHYSGIHYLETVLSALNRISTQLDTEWKVRIGKTSDDTARPIPSGTNVGKVLIDVGPKTSLFVGHGLNENATTIVVRGSSGEDPAITGVSPESIKSSFDASEYVSTVEYLETVGGENFDTLDVTDENIPYRDINGNLLERVIYASEPEHPHISKEERARAFLSSLKQTKKNIDLDLDYYDIQGDFEVGDNIFIYDPELGFEDTEAKKVEDGRTSLFEVSYQGEYINPEKIRVTAITHPIKNGMGVYLRRLRSVDSGLIEYVDLTPYMQWETGGARLEVGDAQLKLGDDLRFSPTVTGITSGSKITVPDKVRDPDNYSTYGINLTSGFIEDGLGVSRAIIKAEWRVPTNDDGSIIQNGSHYNIRYRKVGSTDPYSFNSVDWGNETHVIEGLALATNYEVGVQAVNSNGAVSDYVDGTITTAVDSVAPSKPGPASTIAAGALRVQIIHKLGRAVDDDGNAIGSIVDYTLQNDIDHLNVYASTTTGYSLANDTLKAQYKVGELPATAAHIRDAIPVVGEVQVSNGAAHYWRFTAVDIAGNESAPSDQQTAAGNLVATANISDAAITEAKINNLAVTTAKIADATITNAKIGDVIQSDNYSSGSAGWTIKKTASGYPNGYLEVNDAIIRGNITATTGAIGGWTVAASTLSSGNMTIDAGNNRIQANYSSGSSGFRLNNDGSVEFNDGTFRGELTGATINIGSGNSVFKVDSDGDMYLGNANQGSAPFAVTKDGALTASSVTITGGELHI